MTTQDINWKDMVPYWYAAEGKIVYLVNCDRDDGASLIVEACDATGDVLSGEFFRCEARELEVCSKERWEVIYPPGGENLSFPGTW